MARAQLYVGLQTISRGIALIVTAYNLVEKKELLDIPLKTIQRGEPLVQIRPGHVIGLESQAAEPQRSPYRREVMPCTRSRR